MALTHGDGICIYYTCTCTFDIGSTVYISCTVPTVHVLKSLDNGLRDINLHVHVHV